MKNAPAPWHNSPIMKALRREQTDHPPIWLMRQAGRYMPEYRAVREKVGFLELCRSPHLAAEVMATAVEKIGVDAAIIFSDLLPILEPMGFDLEFSSGDGPIIHNPLRSPKDLARIDLRNGLSALDFVFETVRETRKMISPEKPVIGFAGAPFTLAGYAIEGGSSKNFDQTKTLMRTSPDLWNEFLDKIAQFSAAYLNEQIKAGAQIVQIFDSWIGILGVEDYQRFVFPHVQKMIQSLIPGIPVIYFGTGNPELLPLFAMANPTAVGVDWRIPLDQAWEKIGHDRVIQGNLDPSVLLADEKTIRSEARRICRLAGNRPGFIFNLGHGIIKNTPVENVKILVDEVHHFQRNNIEPSEN